VTDALAHTDEQSSEELGFRVGSAPDSWGVWFPRDPRQTPWTRFLDEIARAGYE
jgi:inosose dehydratase